MAGNDWINGYLEAILDAGSALEKRDDGKINLVEVIHEDKEKTKLFSPTKYFVEEVINSFDESALYKIWTKVIATRTSREPSNRLENVCWRIWHLSRKKQQIQWDDVQKLAERRLVREQGRNDAAQDLSELSEGEKEPGDKFERKKQMSRIRSVTQLWTDEEKPRQHYIVLISMHGLVRGENMELGRDSDTGGQVKYVVELARALAHTEGIFRVDLLTRQVTSPDVDSSYGEPIEMLAYPEDGFGSSGAYIIRIPCGPRDKYIQKEGLWPYVPEFVDGALSHIVTMARALGEQVNNGKPTWPYVIHGHYGDAGEVAAHLSGVLNVPMVLTGHSLGRNKYEQLLKQGRLSRRDIISTYNLARRIEGEERALDAAELVVTSTRQEIEEQWGLYDGFDPKLERKLRVRRHRGVSCFGRNMPRMVVIPPGLDFSNVMEQDLQEGDLKSMIGSTTDQLKKPVPPIWSEIMRFFTNPHKPTILALSRPDPKKNVTTLLKAFGESKALRDLANLTLILGNRDSIEEMPASSSTVLTTVLKLVDQYDLYGLVAYPKHHKQSDVPEIYRFAAKTKGVFINPALVEPFGLTIIEAAAYGLPVVATKNGGPTDILKVLNNGLLVDPHDDKEVAESLLKLVGDKNRWSECRKNGLKNIHKFSWTEHCHNYLSYIQQSRNRHPKSELEITPIQEEQMSDSLKDVDDLSLRFSLEADPNEQDAAVRHKKLIEKMNQMTKSNNTAKVGYSPGRRQFVNVIATDCYDNNGNMTASFSDIVMKVIKAAGATHGLGRVGFVLMTGSTIKETMEALKGCSINIEDLDAIICNSGSELYYPWKGIEVDEDYESHVEYRWPEENIIASVKRLALTEEGEEGDVVEYDAACSSRCLSYVIKEGAKVRRADELRQTLRMRGFRCNVVYTNAATRLNVIPLFASRLQCLRYLSIKWGVDLAKVAVFIGDGGDTDYEDMMVGVHKTVVVKGIVECDSERLMRTEDSFRRADTVPLPNPNLGYVEKDCEVRDLVSVLEVLAVK